MIARGLIVSAQARPDNPLHGPMFMAAMARAASEGGAVAIRANGPADIAAIRAVVRLPIIGILKRRDPGAAIEITPDFAAAKAVAEAGADVIALDATARPRPEPLDRLIARVRDELGKPVFADVATLDEGIAAADRGAAYVATTLAGYTAYSPAGDGPDLALVAALAARLSVPVIAEGRFTDPTQLAAAFIAGAHAVVIGTAITNPRAITHRFAGAVP